MKEYEVTKAKLNRPDLKFTKGRWTRKGKFRLNGTIEGEFELRFSNGSQNELNLSLSLNSYRHIRYQTFSMHENRFKREILDIISPVLEPVLQQIRDQERQMEKLPVLIHDCEQLGKNLKVTFSLGENNDRRYQWTVFKENDEWVYDNLLNDAKVSSEVQYSSWRAQVWEEMQKDYRLMLPLLIF